MFLDSKYSLKQGKNYIFKCSSQAAPLFKLTQGSQRPQCGGGGHELSTVRKRPEKVSCYVLYNPMGLAQSGPCS